MLLKTNNHKLYQLGVNAELYQQIVTELKAKEVSLVAVSKTKSVEDILELYHLGQRDFGENYVQELVEKQDLLPKDIRWHFIGHLQSNKVRMIAPFVFLIHSVDTEKLLKQIDKEAKKNNRIIDCLLEIYIAKETTKFGFSAEEIEEMIPRISAISSTKAGGDQQITPSTTTHEYKNICIKGLMGMASFTDDREKVRTEFRSLRSLFRRLSTVLPHSSFKILSMGMSADYEMAIEEGSNLVRIGSLLFGKRQYP